jgi:hypothetical protein
MNWAWHINHACAIALLLSGIALADPGDVLLKVRNDYYRSVGVWVRSEKNQNPNPWVHQTVEAKGNSQFTLRSPDRYIIVVDIDDQRSRSKPVELKRFLTKHPDFVMNLSVKQFLGAPPGGGDPGGELQGAVGPSPGQNSTDAADYLGLEFGPEPQGN